MHMYMCLYYRQAVSNPAHAHESLAIFSNTIVDSFGSYTFGIGKDQRCNMILYTHRYILIYSYASGVCLAREVCGFIYLNTKVAHCLVIMM